jgi:hypothetical protein
MKYRAGQAESVFLPGLGSMQNEWTVVDGRQGDGSGFNCLNY